MPYRKEQFINGEIYHIVLRGIDDNLIFKDIDDYYRGIFSIYEFNTTKPITIRARREARLKIKKLQKETRRGPSSVTDERDKLVDIFAFCFMPNHIHLLVRQIKEGGITKFMSKVGTGYGRHFNKKYSRKGYVFQNRFLAVHIKNDEQLKTVFVYIHTNPISLIEPNWKEKGIKNPQKVIKFLENYKWSSYQDYIGKKNFPSATEKKFILKIINKKNGCKDFVENWVRYKREIKGFAELSLEN
jgi:putative transposase